VAEDVARDEKPKLTLGQAIDQVISALASFNATNQQTILRADYAHLNIAGPRLENPGTQREPEPSREARTTAKASNDSEYVGLDIKSFRDLKKPSSARQMACVVAYYLAEIATGDEHKGVITTADIEKNFKQARYPLPNKLEQLLVDCKGSGYFDSPSRGEYKLTRVGHNLVAHQLPAKSKG